MAVSSVATSKFPKGTVFVIEAWAPLAEADGTEVKDPSVLADFLSGGIDVGVNFGFHSDTGIAGATFNPPIPTKGGGAYMFPVSSLDALADGQPAPLFYIPVPNGGPDGIEVAPDGLAMVAESILTGGEGKLVCNRTIMLERLTNRFSVEAEGGINRAFGSV